MSSKKVSFLSVIISFFIFANLIIYIRLTSINEQLRFIVGKLDRLSSDFVSILNENYNLDYVLNFSTKNLALIVLQYKLYANLLLIFSLSGLIIILTLKEVSFKLKAMLVFLFMGTLFAKNIFGVIS